MRGTVTVVEAQTELDRNYDGTEVVRVKYREQGQRRWTKLVVFPAADQSVDELLRQGDLIADAHRKQVSA